MTTKLKIKSVKTIKMACLSFLEFSLSRYQINVPIPVIANDEKINSTLNNAL